jgi:threonine/homoserine/homoserine lactone efflux protein
MIGLAAGTQIWIVAGVAGCGAVYELGELMEDSEQIFSVRYLCFLAASAAI